MAAARGYPGPLVTRRKAFRSLHASFRKGRARGGLGHTGQRRDAHIARCGYRTSCATGMEPGSAVPASTTRDVRRRGRAWQRLLQPTRRGRSVTRGAARRRPSISPCEGFAVDARAIPQSRESSAIPVEAGPSESKAIPPMKLEPRERDRAGRGAHSVPMDA